MITTLKTIQSIDLNVNCLMCHDGFIRHIQLADASLPEHGPVMKHFSEIFKPEVNAVIAGVIYESRYLPGQYQKRISTGAGEKSQFIDVAISSIEIPDSSHPFFQVTVRSHPVKDTRSDIFRDLLDHSPNFIMVFGSVRNSAGIISDFKLKYANRNGGLLSIDDVQNLTGKKLAEILPEFIISRFREHFKQVVDSGNPFEDEFLFESDNSEKMWLHCLIRRYDDGFAATFQDITTRKKEVRKTSDLNEQLRYTNAQKDKLFSIIAHDFRSPFAGCLGMLEMVLEDKDSYDRAELYEMLEMIYKQSQSTFHLLESLLDWASVQQGQLNYAPVKTDLQALADLMCNMLGNDAREKKIELLNRIPDQTIVFADTYMLKTILRNLISNGIKFTNPEGRIVIDAGKKGAMIEISVCDNGIGIQKSSQKKIFDIDYQYIGRGTKGEKGTGIGLHVCRDFVHKHGGDIRVESEPGSGSIFRFTLPTK